MIKLVFIILLIGCTTPKAPIQSVEPQKKNTNMDALLDEEQKEEYYECVSEGGEYLNCWCHAVHGDDEDAFDLCIY